MDFSSFSYFNPRLREGGDNSTRLSINSCFVFQSTPPRRRRQFDSKREMHRYLISIHASEKEATDCICAMVAKMIFQSTPPRRRRPSSHIGANCVRDFNPRLREGGDAYFHVLVTKIAEFQSTPPRRRRHTTAQIFWLKNNFNPRLREGGDFSESSATDCKKSISIHASEKEATN